MLASLAGVKTCRVAAAGMESGRLLYMVFPRGRWSVRCIVVRPDTLDRQIVFPASHTVQVDNRRRRLHVGDQPEFGNPEVRRAMRFAGAYAVHANEEEVGVLEDGEIDACSASIVLSGQS